MVICDLCKGKVADKVHSADPAECATCNAEICEKCALDLGDEVYCKAHSPACKDCGTTLTAKFVFCELCEEMLHRTCAFKVKYDEPADELAHPLIMMKKFSLLSHESKGWLCKAHFEKFEAHKADSTVIIEYAIKLFKTLGLPPLKIQRHITPDETPNLIIASLALKNDWEAFVAYPKNGNINITMRGFDFDTTVKVTTYNHETAVNTLRDKLIKLLLHHKRALVSNKRIEREYDDDDDEFDGATKRLVDILGGYSSIRDRESQFQAINGVTDMLRILTASKNANIQD